MILIIVIVVSPRGRRNLSFSIDKANVSQVSISKNLCNAYAFRGSGKFVALGKNSKLAKTHVLIFYLNNYNVSTLRPTNSISQFNNIKY